MLVLGVQHSDSGPLSVSILCSSTMIIHLRSQHCLMPQTFSILHPLSGSNPGCHIAFIFMSPWSPPAMRVSQVSLVFHNLETFEECWVVIRRTSAVGSSHVLPWLHWVNAMMYFSVYWIKGTWGQSALLLTMLTFILKVGSSSFFPAKSLFFPLQFINNSFRVDDLRLCKSLFSLNSVHKCQHLSVVPACSKFYWVF